jgi:hypothetical protein
MIIDYPGCGSLSLALSSPSPSDNAVSSDFPGLVNVQNERHEEPYTLHERIGGYIYQ